MSYGFGSRECYLLPNPSEHVHMLYVHAYMCVYKGLHYFKLDVNSPKILFPLPSVICDNNHKDLSNFCS